MLRMRLDFACDWTAVAHMFLFCTICVRRSACGLAQCQLWHDTLSLVLCLAGGSMRSSRPIRYSKVWPYVEDTKSRSKVSESEEDLANSGYASPSCFSLCWFAWKADCSASVRQYLWSGRRVAGFWLRQRQTGIHILFATLQIQPDMIEVRSFGSISYILGSV